MLMAPFRSARYREPYTRERLRMRDEHILPDNRFRL